MPHFPFKSTISTFPQSTTLHGFTGELYQALKEAMTPVFNDFHFQSAEAEAEGRGLR